MKDTLSEQLAQTAVDLSISHPHAKAIEIIDLVLAGRTGKVDSLGPIHPTSPFGQLIATAFDRAMDPRDWKLIDNTKGEPRVVAALWGIWYRKVLIDFANHYGLEP